MKETHHHRPPLLHTYFSIILISTLFINGFIYSSYADSPIDVSWEAIITIDEITGKTDYSLIGESTEANDGPPADSYDMPKAPTSPPPYLRLWGTDNLPNPYTQLLGDYRHYPDTSKRWNLSLLWYPTNPTDPPTNVTITWNSNELSQSEYTTIELYSSDDTLVANMLQISTYTFSCPNLIPQHFTIKCTGSNFPPNVPSTPSGPTNGYHNSAYAYSTATADPENDQIAYRFDWDDGSPNQWTALYPSGAICTQSHIWQIPGVYTISVKARDSNNAESLWTDTLSITMLNQPPRTPTNPTPGNNSDQVSTSQTLSWDCSDPDGNTLTYNIFLGNTSNPPKIISRQASTSFTPFLDSKTLSYWRIVAYDDYGGITPGPLWIFTTKDSGSSSGDGSVSKNIPPVANASLSEQTGLVKSQVQFDGSQSFDEDGYLINWLWDFNDGHTVTGEITTHTFTEKGEYLVTLTVTDDASAESIDTIMVTILTANTPPDIPIITGPVFGTINHPYLFNFTINDLDNDLLEIAINWGDNTNSSLLDKISDTTVPVNHSWTTAGPYTMQARTSDSYTWSSLSEFMILINTIYFPNFGYILDQNNDGIYDKYLTLKQDELLVLEVASATSYGLDIDGDAEWDYLLDTLSTEVKSYSPSTSVVDHWWILPLLGIIVLIIFIAILLVIKRSGK